MLVKHNILFKFKATFSHINKRFTVKSENSTEWKSGLTGLFHPACPTCVVSWFAFVVAIFMGHENGDDKGKPRDDTSKECWMKQTL